MGNALLNAMKVENNYTTTLNGGLAYKSTGEEVYDLYGLGGAYRKRTDEDCILLFKKAFDADPTYALKCLFYLRDVRGGAGERRFFRVCMRYLAGYNAEAAMRNLQYIPEFGRWDDLIDITYGTSLWSQTISLIKSQLAMDMSSCMVSEKTPVSLLAKWLPSENTSSMKTRAIANDVCKSLKLSHKQYRKTLSALRTRINIVEKLMSSNQWDKIEFDKLPSKAGKIYKKAFIRHDLQRTEQNKEVRSYADFAKDKNTKVNTGTLCPYECVAEALKTFRNGYSYNVKLPAFDDTNRLMVNKYWENLTDYFKDATLNALCMVDTSGSMVSSEAAAPINVAISLGLYCAERAKGPFAGHYISFSSRPQLIPTEGVDFVDKVYRIYKTNLCENTNLEAAFNMLLNTAVINHLSQDDMPKTIIVLSDMGIDVGTEYRSTWGRRVDAKAGIKTMMENMRDRWAAAGYRLPNLVYWNVNASKDTFLDDGPNITYVSGFSAQAFEQILKGKTGIEMMYDKLNSERYSMIK